jgi:hypothetical protein
MHFFKKSAQKHFLSGTLYEVCKKRGVSEKEMLYKVCKKWGVFEGHAA